MLKGDHAQLVGITETVPELVQAAKTRGASNVPFFDDYQKMLEETQPDFAWAFVENNRHQEIVQACAPKKIHVIFEQPLAATYAQASVRRLARQHGIKVMTKANTKAIVGRGNPAS